MGRQLLVLCLGPPLHTPAISRVLAGLAERDYTRLPPPNNRDSGPPARPQLGCGGHVAVAVVLPKDFWSPPPPPATATSVAGPAATPTRRQTQRRHGTSASTGPARNVSPAATAKTRPSPRRQSPRGLPARSATKSGEGSAGKRRRTPRPRDTPGSAAKPGGPAGAAGPEEVRPEDWCWPGACPGAARTPQWCTGTTAKV